MSFTVEQMYDGFRTIVCPDIVKSAFKRGIEKVEANNSEDPNDESYSKYKYSFVLNEVNIKMSIEASVGTEYDPNLQMAAKLRSMNILSHEYDTIFTELFMKNYNSNTKSPGEIIFEELLQSSPLIFGNIPDIRVEICVFDIPMSEMFAKTLNIMGCIVTINRMNSKSSLFNYTIHYRGNRIINIQQALFIQS